MKLREQTLSLSDSFAILTTFYSRICFISFAGYNYKKKANYLKNPGNSGWLRLHFIDLENPVNPKHETTTFYSKVTESSTRKMSVSLGDMELTMLQGGQIKVKTFTFFLEKLSKKLKYRMWFLNNWLVKNA